MNAIGFGITEFEERYKPRYANIESNAVAAGLLTSCPNVVLA